MRSASSTKDVQLTAVQSIDSTRDSKASSMEASGKSAIDGRRKHFFCRSPFGSRGGPAECCLCSPLCLLLFPICAFVGLLIVLSIGSAIERGHMDNAEETGWVYETAELCSVSNTTYTRLDALHDAGQSVRHCGACGQCSNDHDVQIYYDTLKTLTDTTTTCAFKAVMQGEGAVTRCMEDRVNLTEGCTRCWVENVMCDLDKCVFSCMLYRMGLGGSKNADGGELNRCLECDEKRCGPPFIRCAGANRRRSGIYSDIERNFSHVCKVVEHGPALGMNHSNGKRKFSDGDGQDD